MPRIMLTRDSVCMADDVMAPNAGTIDVADDLSLAEVARAIMDSGYLASIAGGSATWHVEEAGAGVVFGWVRDQPFLHTVGSGSRLARDIPALHIRYAAQNDPQAVVDRLTTRLEDWPSPAGKAM